ncbi:MAG: hypothetical protein IOD12_17630 [Silvanigrellales bacterium]|nr:hypothetical protein [Silvanigrellales bacterium]
MTRTKSAFAFGLSLAGLALMAACGDDSSKTTAGVAPESQKEVLKKQGDQKLPPKGKTDDSKIVVNPKQGDGKIIVEGPKKDEPQEDEPKTEEPKQGGVIVLPPVHVSPVQGQTKGNKGTKGHMDLMKGDWTYQGCDCLPTQQALSSALVGGLNYQFQQGQFPGQQQQQQHQGQGGVFAVPAKTLLKIDGDVVQLFVQQQGQATIDMVQQGKVVVQAEQTDAGQGQSQAQVKFWQTQQSFEDSLVVDQGQTLYVTEQSQDCANGKVVQKYMKKMD